MVCSINLITGRHQPCTQLTKIVRCRPMHDCVGVIIGGVQHIDGPLQVKYWGGVLTPVTPAALTPMATLHRTIMLSV